MKKNFVPLWLLPCLVVGTLLSCSPHSDSQPGQGSSGPQLVNKTSEHVTVWLGALNETNGVLIGSIAANQQATIGNVRLPDTQTHYTITAVNANSTVIYYTRFPKEYFAGAAWEVEIPNLVPGGEQPIRIRNESPESIRVYVGAWDGETYFSSGIGDVASGNEAVFHLSNVDAGQGRVWRVMAFSGQRNVMVYSRWFDWEEFEQANWTILVPENMFGVWDSYRRLSVSNDTGSDLDFFIYTGNEIWRTRLQGGFKILGRIDPHSQLDSGEYRVSGPLGWQYINILEAATADGTTIFRRVLTDNELTSMQYRITITATEDR